MALRFIFVAIGCKAVFAYQRVAIPKFAKDHGSPLMEKFEQQYIDGHWARDIYGNGKTGNENQQMLAASKVEAAKDRFVLHHIWKCGGTRLCEVARQSGFSAPNNDGCHRWKDRAGPEEDWAPCAVNSTMASLPYSVIGHECPVEQYVMEQAASQGFKWVEVLRDPIEQAASWYMHAVNGKYVPAGNLTEWLRKSKIASPSFYNFIPNLQVNWLGGCGENVNEDCFQKALANLEQMDVVLEQSGETLLGTDKLVKLGWHFPKPSTDQGFVSAAQTYMKTMPSAERKILEEVQAYDRKLLRVARKRGLI